MSSKMRSAARLLVREMVKEQRAFLTNLKSTNPGEYAQLVEVYKENVAGTKNPTIKELTVAEVDMLLGSGDALRCWLESLENEMCDVWLEEF